MEQAQFSDELDAPLLRGIPVLSYEQELKALDKELAEHKFEILAGRYDFVEQNKRRQWLMKKLAGPIEAPPPVPIRRMDRVVVTGMEDAPLTGSRAGQKEI